MNVKRLTMKALMLISVILLMVGCWVNHNQKTCYWCKESIKSEAIICKYCGKKPSDPNAPLPEGVTIGNSPPENN